MTLRPLFGRERAYTVTALVAQTLRAKADSHPVDSLSSVLMCWLMEPFDQRNSDGSKSFRARLRVIDGGVKD